MQNQLSIKRLVQIVAAVVVTWLLWNTWVVYPVRILVTFLHEISHGLAAVLTGGRISHITIETNGSGICWTQGGWRPFVISAGYLGSMFWGNLILLLASRTRLDKLISFTLGAGLVVMCLFYVRTWFGFGFGVLMGCALMASGLWLKESINDLILMFIGSVSCLYSLFDIKVLWQVRGAVENDAVSFSKEVLPLPPAVWVTTWCLLAILCMAWTLPIALREHTTGMIKDAPYPGT